MNTNLKGEIAEQIAGTRLMKMDFIVSMPINKTVYDLLIDDGKKIFKVQVKKANIKDDYIKFMTSTSSTNTKKTTRKQYTKEDVDYFVVVNIDEELAYMIDVNECSKDNQRLRLTKTKNGQTKNIKFAKDYLI